MFIDKEQHIYQCRECGHQFTVIPENSQEKYDEQYFREEHKNWFAHPDYLLYDLIYSKIVAAFPNKQVKILDVGCGIGSFLERMKSKNKNFELHGIDLKNNESEGINFFEGSIFDYNSQKKFEVIVSLGTIEHIDNLHLFLQKVSSLLEQNGMVVMMTINNNSLIYRLGRVLKKTGIDFVFNRLYSAHHLHHFSEYSLKKLFFLYRYKIIFHKKHNYPIRAVDFPLTNFLVKFFLTASVYILFQLSSMVSMGQLQTIIVRREKN